MKGITCRKCDARPLAASLAAANIFLAVGIVAAPALAGSAAEGAGGPPALLFPLQGFLIAVSLASPPGPVRWMLFFAAAVIAGALSLISSIPAQIT